MGTAAASGASGSVTDKSRPRGHRSQGCSRETSPSRSGTGEEVKHMMSPRRLRGVQPLTASLGGVKFKKRSAAERSLKERLKTRGSQRQFTLFKQVLVN